MIYHTFRIYKAFHLNRFHTHLLSLFLSAFLKTIGTCVSSKMDVKFLSCFESFLTKFAAVWEFICITFSLLVTIKCLNNLFVKEKSSQLCRELRMIFHLYHIYMVFLLKKNLTSHFWISGLNCPVVPRSDKNGGL